MGAVSRFLRLSAVALLTGGLLAVLSVAQTLSQGEISIRSGAYQLKPPVLRTESRLVRIDAVVRDSNGRIISGLSQADFTILDNGRSQPISTFTIEKRQLRTAASPAVPPTVAAQPISQPQLVRPRYVALYFDDLHTKPGDMRHVQLAAENFVHTGLSANDQIALFTSSSTATVDFTPDAAKVLAAIGNVSSHFRDFASGTCPRISGFDAYLIVNHLDPDAYDTALEAAKQCNCDDQLNMDKTCYVEQERSVMIQAQQTWEPMRELSENTLETIQEVVNYLGSKPGQRVLVLASSGFLAGSLERQIDSVIDNALRGGILINALDAKGLYTEDPSHGRALNELIPNSKAGAMAFRRENEIFGPYLLNLTDAMADFAVGTGGRFFHNRNDLDAGYYSLAAAPETEYLLGFVPQKEKLDGRFHKLKVEVNRPGKFSVQARPGYFAPTKASEEKISEPAPEQTIDAEVRGSESRSDFPLAVNEKSATATNAPELHVQIHVDIQKLPFQQENGRRVDMVTFIAALFDAGGKMVAGKEAQMQFALKPDSFKRLSESGINGDMSLEAPPGAYRLRVVVQEALRSRISAMTQTVRVQ